MPDSTSELNFQDQEILPEQLLFLLSTYLDQNIIRPIEIDTSQLAYRWVNGCSGKLIPIDANLSISLDDLQGIDKQKSKIIQNTKQFLAGLPANHVLMTGTRGSGKSSLVKALLNSYHQYGLRIIEVTRDDLLVLDKIRKVINDLNDHRYKYIIYCDDLAFEKQDENYRTLKSLLDGSLDSEQDKILVYATSNRRHLLPQMMKDNLSIYNGQTDEVNPYETIDETVSLSDRFGLWLSFHPMDQQTYLNIVRHYINTYEVDWGSDAEKKALQWASEKGSRSGRIAYQFSRQYVGAIKLANQDLELQKVNAKAKNKLTISEISLNKILNEKKEEGQFSTVKIVIFMAILTLIFILIAFIIRTIF